MAGCYFTENSMAPQCRALYAAMEQVQQRNERVRKFLTAYISESAMTFVDPATGDLVTAGPEVRAFALAVINGPMTVVYE